MGLCLLVLAGVPAAGQSLRGPGSGPAGGAEAGSGLPVPEFAKPLMSQIARAQRELNATLSREMRAVRQSGSPGAALAVAGVAFLYGILHAAGPGHGKLVVSSFFLARDTRLLTGVLAGLLFSLLQAVSSIILVAVLALALEWGGFEILGQSVRVELVSYVLIVGIGIYLTVTALRGDHDHHATTPPAGPRRPPSSLWSVVTAAGLTPCASAIIILLFAWANRVFALGVGATLVMALGMAITVCAMGLAAIGARRAVLRSARGRPGLFRWARQGLSVTGGALITVFGCLLFASAWTRLP
jgi:nickel/cobalt transporter (NicO) family protein